MIVLLAPLASSVPLCSLAAILFVVSYYMSDVPHFIHIVKRAPYYDVVVLLATFLLTVFINLVIAVGVGVILAMAFFVYRMNQMIDIKQENNEHSPSLPKDTLLYTIEGPFFFGVAEKFERAMTVTHTQPKNIIIQLKYVPFMDMTGLETFSEMLARFHKKGVAIYLCGANEVVTKKLIGTNVWQWVKGQQIFESVEAIKATQDL